MKTVNSESISFQNWWFRTGYIMTSTEMLLLVIFLWLVCHLMPQLEASVLKLVMFMQATNVVSERSLEEYRRPHYAFKIHFYILKYSE